MSETVDPSCSLIDAGRDARKAMRHFNSSMSDLAPLAVDLSDAVEKFHMEIQAAIAEMGGSNEAN